MLLQYAALNIFLNKRSKKKDVDARHKAKA
jgi:hypothetical protein